MSILDSLARDHRQLETLISTLGSMPSTDAAERVKLFSRLQSLLQGHSRAEEEVVYRRLRARRPEEEETLEAYEEHHVADVLLQELASARSGGIAWTAKVKVLEEVLRHHIKEEEQQLFPLVRESFDERQQVQMDVEFQTLKHEGIELFLGPIRRATPAFAGRAAITMQAAAGRYARRGELYLRRRLAQLRRA